MESQEAIRVTEYFRARLAEEVRRSERYGRSFSVIFAGCRRTEARDIFNTLRPFLRCTDIVEIICVRPRAPDHADGEPTSGFGADAAYERVAVILPETSRSGAEVALARLWNQCRRLADLKLGLAVYPTDSANPQELLTKAAAAAGEDIRF